MEANEFINEYSIRSDYEEDSAIWSSLNIGQIYEAGDHIVKAKEYYRIAYGLDPKNVTALYRLAYLLIVHDMNIEEGMKLIISGGILVPEHLELYKGKLTSKVQEE